MATSFIDYTRVDNNNIQAQSPAIPAGTQEGDFILALLHGDLDLSGRDWTETAAGGWTKHGEYIHISGRDRTLAIFYKFAGASEPTPTFDFGVADAQSQMLLAYRGVDKDQPFDVAIGVDDAANTTQGDNPPLTTVTDDAMMVLWSAYTHDDLDAAGAPSGYTLRIDGTGASQDHRQDAVADKLLGAAGTETPSAWQNTVRQTQQEWSGFSIALRPGGPFLGSELNAYDGGAWVPGKLKRYDGADWVGAQVQRWTGSAWEDVP